MKLCLLVLFVLVAGVALVNSVDLACDFDSSSCGYTNDRTGNFRWWRHSNATLTSFTGPSSDHTSGSGYYMYIEASHPRQIGDKARYLSPFISISSDVCVSFYYHMYGNSMGSLNVYVKRSITRRLGRAVWSRQGNLGDTWRMAQISVNPAPYVQVVFEGVVGQSIASDIAIDDISVKHGLCGHPDLACDFDSSSCGYTNDRTGNFRWWRHSNATISSFTGPSSDHTSGSGYYMYIEASHPRQIGDKARYLSPVISISSGVCVSFYYHMYGNSMGSLNVYIKHSNTRRLGRAVWSRQGDQGDTWRMAQISVNPAPYVQVVFEGVVGGDFSSDIAIDDISVKQGLCVHPVLVGSSCALLNYRVCDNIPNAECAFLASGWICRCKTGFTASVDKTMCE